jgi:hypothetical protein
VRWGRCIERERARIRGEKKESRERGKWKREGREGKIEK